MPNVHEVISPFELKFYKVYFYRKGTFIAERFKCNESRIKNIFNNKYYKRSRNSGSRGGKIRHKIKSRNKSSSKRRSYKRNKKKNREKYKSKLGNKTSSGSGIKGR